MHADSMSVPVAYSRDKYSVLHNSSRCISTEREKGISRLYTSEAYAEYERHTHLYGLPPVLRLGGDGERGDSAALPGAVAMVHLNADEGRAGSGAVARVDAELQDAEHEASHEARPHAGQGVHGLDRQLAEEGQHEVLQ